MADSQRDEKLNAYSVMIAANDSLSAHTWKPLTLQEAQDFAYAVAFALRKIELAAARRGDL